MFLILKQYTDGWALADKRQYGSIKDAEIMATNYGGFCRIITKSTYEMIDKKTGEVHMDMDSPLQQWFKRRAMLT